MMFPKEDSHEYVGRSIPTDRSGEGGCKGHSWYNWGKPSLPYHLWGVTNLCNFSFTSSCLMLRRVRR
jgi:hypothetical protein